VVERSRNQESKPWISGRSATIAGFLNIRLPVYEFDNLQVGSADLHFDSLSASIARGIGYPTAATELCTYYLAMDMGCLIFHQGQR